MMFYKFFLNIFYAFYITFIIFFPFLILFFIFFLIHLDKYLEKRKSSEGLGQRSPVDHGRL